MHERYGVQKRLQEHFMGRFIGTKGSADFAAYKAKTAGRPSISARKVEQQEEVKRKEVLEISKLFRDAVKLAMVAGGDNRTDITNKTIKVASPRFLSIVPDEENNDRVSLLMPYFVLLEGNN
ncbi:unnamed protein product [Gongylonema pulchrum]|uniref:PI3K/PI4K domain-containing protein n=1 Tax=Gongylonema pulchrum TaxID=637853 RepID=A0A183CUL9_9BILA|nr:unnamed protein product [Gongylonema pulchrum]